MTKTEKRDPKATYNKMSINDMKSTLCADKFDFDAYFEAIGKSSQALGEINVCTTKAITEATALIASTEPDTIENYLRWRVVHDKANYLSKAFVDEHFDFYSKNLQGQKEQKPRWKRAMQFTESALGEALG